MATQGVPDLAQGYAAGAVTRPAEEPCHVTAEPTPRPAPAGLAVPNAAGVSLSGSEEVASGLQGRQCSHRWLVGTSFIQPAALCPRGLVLSRLFSSCFGC